MLVAHPTMDPYQGIQYKYPGSEEKQAFATRRRSGGGRTHYWARKMSDGPKLYTNKPKKGQMKAKGFSSPSMGSSPTPSSSSSSSSPPSSPSPPPPVKESFARRYKFLWPLLLTVNLAVGAYLFVRTNNKEKGEEGGEVSEKTSAPPASLTPLVIDKPFQGSPATKPIERPPIYEDEQRQLFKWMLEERRKVKPENPLEKKRIDEEKAILKQYIRAKSIPSF